MPEIAIPTQAARPGFHARPLSFLIGWCERRDLNPYELACCYSVISAIYTLYLHLFALLQRLPGDKEETSQPYSAALPECLQEMQCQTEVFYQLGRINGEFKLLELASPRKSP